MVNQQSLNELSLFAGAGGGILAGRLLGWRTVCAVEWEPYPASVLCARQNDGILPPFPIWDDIQTFDGRPWRGIVQVVSGGFPCQDISAAGGGQESTESEAECGEKWHGSFVKYDLDSSLWRTHQCSLLGDLEPFSETWPRWGLMRSGECWEQQTLAHRTSETESGLWRTPDTGAGGTSGLLKEGKTHRENGQPIQIRLVDQVNNPRLWPTPTAQDAKNNGAASQMVRNTKPLNAEVGGALNPMWVEWLMGWPLGWTDLKPLETDRFQKWLEEHGKCYDIGHEA
jgi:DNA (cytosine-5)-methyltransferase 1